MIPKKKSVDVYRTMTNLKTLLINDQAFLGGTAHIQYDE